MIPAVATALDSIVGKVVTLRNAKGAGRAYELYIMTGIAMELKNSAAPYGCKGPMAAALLRWTATVASCSAAGCPRVFPVQRRAKVMAALSCFGCPVPGASGTWNRIKFKGRSGGDHE